jgi:hypothetical protein
VGSHTYLIYLPSWLKFLILVIIGLAVVLKESQKIDKFSLKLGFFYRIWFMPFLFRGTGTSKILFLRKRVNKIGEIG